MFHSQSRAVHTLTDRSQVRRVGRRRLVLDLSCRRRRDAYFVVTDRWQRFSELAVDEASLAALADSCDEFLVRSVSLSTRRARAWT